MLQLMRCELSKQEKNQCLVFATLEEEVKSLAALGGVARQEKRGG